MEFKKLDEIAKKLGFSSIANLESEISKGYLSREFTEVLEGLLNKVDKPKESTNQVNRLIKVNVFLKPSQRLSMNKWECHISGEKRHVTSSYVHWFCKDLESAINSIKIDEVDSFNIASENWG